MASRSSLAMRRALSRCPSAASCNFSHRRALPRRKTAEGGKADPVARLEVVELFLCHGSGWMVPWLCGGVNAKL